MGIMGYCVQSWIKIDHEEVKYKTWGYLVLETSIVMAKINHAVARVMK